MNGIMVERFSKGSKAMGLLPMGIDILPPSDDRVFKLILALPEGKPVLINLISSVIKRPVVDVVVRSNELPVDDVEGKAGHLDMNVVSYITNRRFHMMLIRNRVKSFIYSFAKSRNK